jgi:hypothetical protein
MSVTEMELKSFNEFVAEQMENGNTLSLEQCFDRWLAERERQELLQDIQLSIADIEAGRVWTLEEADAEIRRRLGWPAQS